MVEEKPAAVVAFALSHFSTVVPCNQQFDCGKSESAAHVLKSSNGNDQPNPLLVCKSRRWLHARRILGERDEALVATATGRDRNLSFPADDLPPVNQMNLPK
jgi:hypothetical protein